MKLFEIIGLVEFAKTGYYPYKWLQKTNSDWYGEFQAEDDSKITFSATVPNDQGWEISWLRNNVSGRIQTDPGLASKILSTINAMINDFISEVHPESIYVTVQGNDTRKMSIYTRILAKMGYSIRKLDDEEAEELNLDNEYSWWEYWK